MKKKILVIISFITFVLSCYSATTENGLEWKFLDRTQKSWLAKIENSVNIDNDYIMITGYNGDASIIALPKEIEGYPVIASTIFMLPKKCNKVIVPETIVYLSDPFHVGEPHPEGEIELLNNRKVTLALEGTCFKYFKKLPMDVDIHTWGDIDFGKLTTVIWSKNWKTNPHPYDNMNSSFEDGIPSAWIKYERKKITGILSLVTSELTNTSGFSRPTIVGENIKEVIFEEGCEEITGGLLGSCRDLERVVIPKSMKFIFRGKHTWNTLCADDLKGEIDIEIAEGCKVEFEDKSYLFPVNKISVKTRKRFQEFGFKF